MDETCVRFNGRRAYVYRAIDQGGQVADVYFSERQSAALAGSFFGRAIVETGVQPACVTTDKAKCYPPAMKSVLPDSEPR